MSALKFKAVLFDLDDTLFDHQLHRREALAAVRTAAGLHSLLAMLEEAHERHLQRTHRLLLAGACSLEEARTERMRAILKDHGIEANGDRLLHLEDVYRAAYDRHWRQVPGSIELLEALRSAGAWVGIVTNGRECDQLPKLERLDLCRRVDGILISELVGCQAFTRLLHPGGARGAR